MPDGLRLYLDQMFGLDVAVALRREGHDVLRAAETGLARADDELILAKAIRENRILLTLDEHFGPATTANVVNLLLPFLRLYSSLQFKDHLVILSATRAKWVLTSTS
jgi:hypothetical protein